MKKKRMKKDSVKRSPMNIYAIKNDVHSKIKKLSDKHGVAQWLIAEKLFESALLKFDAKKWLKLK